MKLVVQRPFRDDERRASLIGRSAVSLAALWLAGFSGLVV